MLHALSGLSAHGLSWVQIPLGFVAILVSKTGHMRKTEACTSTAFPRLARAASCLTSEWWSLELEPPTGPSRPARSLLAWSHSLQALLRWETLERYQAIVSLCPAGPGLAAARCDRTPTTTASQQPASESPINRGNALFTTGVITGLLSLKRRQIK